MTPTTTNLTIANGTTPSNITCDQVADDAGVRQDDSHRSNPAQQTWRDAVAFVTLRAKDHYGAELHGRLDKAQALVLDGHVTLDEGAATVTSQASDKRYTVNGTCHCPDSKSQRTPGGICKHRLAVAIHKRAHQEAKYLLDLRSAPAHSADDSAASAPAVPESPVSMNTQIRINHQQVQVTVRTGATSDDYHRVLTVMQEVLAQHPATAALPATQTPQAPLCPVHETPMRPSRFGGHYCPRKNEDGGHCQEMVVA